jgi:hypothetical protein
LGSYSGDGGRMQVELYIYLKFENWGGDLCKHDRMESIYQFKGKEPTIDKPPKFTFLSICIYKL